MHVCAREICAPNRRPVSTGNTLETCVTCYDFMAFARREDNLEETRPEGRPVRQRQPYNEVQPMGRAGESLISCRKLSRNRIEQ